MFKNIENIYIQKLNNNKKNKNALLFKKNREKKKHVPGYQI